MVAFRPGNGIGCPHLPLGGAPLQMKPGPEDGFEVEINRTTLRTDLYLQDRLWRS
jgi:hypothetical protein